MRSNLFIPSFNKEYIDKILITNFDNYIFDLEDSVPDNKKEVARKNIKYFLKKNVKSKNFMFRINGIHSNNFKKDLKMIHEIRDKVREINIVLPKTQNIKDVKFLIRSFKSPFNIYPLIETAQSLINLEKIINCSKKIKGLILGTEDMIADFKATKKSKLVLDLARMRSLIVCRAHNITCIDTVITDVKNLRYFRKFCKESVAEGFDGILCLNLNQAKIAHELFSIDHKEYKRVKKIVNEYERNKNKSVYYYGKKKGIFLSPPTIIIYKNIISKYEKQNK